MAKKNSKKKPAAKQAPKKKAKTAAKAKPKAKAKMKPAPAKAKAKAAPKPKSKPKASATKTPAAKPPATAQPVSTRKSPDEAAAETAQMQNVMASLTKIFGGREFLSDTELDAFLDEKMASGEIPPSAALDPLDEAQSLIYEAWNSSEAERVVLAHRALELSPDCADAYVILAEEEAKDRKQALDFYKKGTEAGQRALGPQFKAAEGRFWEVMETRPYMRARLGLAECLWDLGRKVEALDHLRELMRLNPEDNQGVRYVLVQGLLETGADEELGQWLARFKNDPSPSFKYTHALWMFRREGKSESANARLDVALKANPHVPAYLLKKKKAPKDAPEAVGPGSEEEAAAYATGALDPWNKTLGAIDWLASRSR